MDYLPKFEVTRFEQLKPGDVFHIELMGLQLTALKAIDLKNDGDKCMVLLGPSFPADVPPGRLAPNIAATVISIGSKYTVNLGSQPSNWSVQPPPPDVVAMVLQDEELYVRANFDPRPREFSPCFVKMNCGEVVYGTRGIRAYCLQWEIVIAGTDQTIISTFKRTT